MSQVPLVAWREIDTYVPWGPLGSLLAVSRERQQQVVLEAIRRVVPGRVMLEAMRRRFIPPLCPVVIKGLQERAELNGAFGICRDFDTQTDCWLVDLGHWRIMKVQPGNLYDARKVVRPMAPVGSTRGARQIAAALPALLHAVHGPHETVVRELFNQHVCHVQSLCDGVMLALALVAGVDGPIVDEAPAIVQEMARQELSATLIDACERAAPPCCAHLEALLSAKADVNARVLFNETTSTPLENVLRNSPDLGRWHDAVKLLVLHGARAHTQDIEDAMLRAYSYDNGTGGMWMCEWKVFWRSIIISTNFLFPCRKKTVENILKIWSGNPVSLRRARNWLQQLASVLRELQETRLYTTYFASLQAIDDMVQVIDSRMRVMSCG